MTPPTPSGSPGSPSAPPLVGWIISAITIVGAAAAVLALSPRIALAAILLGIALLIVIVALVKLPTWMNIGLPILLAVSVAISGFVIWLAPTVVNNRSASASLRSPSIGSLSVEWIGEDGRYRMRGQTYNLRDRQIIWNYNQPLEYDTDAPGPVYPEYGPCLVDNDGSFTCDLGYAGNQHCDGQRKFVLWVAIVTDSQAQNAANVKSRLDGRPPYSDRNSVPHVEGERTMLSIVKTHPGVRTTPRPKSCR